MVCEVLLPLPEPYFSRSHKIISGPTQSLLRAFEPRDVRNLTLRPETVTNVPMYVGFELRNCNQHAKMVVFDTEIEINLLIVKCSKSKSKPKCLLMPCSKQKPKPIEGLI